MNAIAIDMGSFKAVIVNYCQSFIRIISSSSSTLYYSISFLVCSYVIRWSRSRMNTLVHLDQMPQTLAALPAIMVCQATLTDRKWALALPLILQKINWETTNKHFEDLISTFFEGIWTIIWGWQVCLMRKEARLVWSESGPEISRKLWLKWVENVVSRRIFTCHGRLPRAKRNYNAKREL